MQTSMRALYHALLTVVHERAHFASGSLWVRQEASARYMMAELSKDLPGCQACFTSFRCSFRLITGCIVLSSLASANSGDAFILNQKSMFKSVLLAPVPAPSSMNRPLSFKPF